MIVESFIAAVQANSDSSLAAPSKDVSIFTYEFQPKFSLRSVFKKSPTSVNCLAANSTHIFATHVDKAVINVFSREKGNQESIIAFPARIHSLTTAGDEVLAMGTAEGRVVLWELSTGRQVSTQAVHLQSVNCLAASKLDLISGSEDSNIHVWSIPNLLSVSSNSSRGSLRCLSNHLASITSLRLGHSGSNTNICVSASKDKSVNIWNYCSGQLLRTFLLPAIPLCLTIDPCDRGVYVGLDNGLLHLIEFVQSNSPKHSLYDTANNTTPLEDLTPPFTAATQVGSIICIELSYDGSYLLSGHASGEIYQWDTGRRHLLSKLVDLNVPVTNIKMDTPFPEEKRTRICKVSKPKPGEHRYVLNTQFTGSKPVDFERSVVGQGFPKLMLENAIVNFKYPQDPSSHGMDQLRKENEDLWKLINEQRAVQKKTWEEYTMLRSQYT